MIGYAARAFLRLLVTVLVAAVLVFVVLDVLPGDPARFMLGLGATDAAVVALRQQLGLDGPEWLRLLAWIGGMLHGDFGLSYTQNAPVSALIAARLAVTLPLALLALLLALSLGLALGLAAARRPEGIGDRLLTGLSRVGVAIPSFWLGMVLVLVFSATLRWLPPGGFVPWMESPLSALASLILPAMALAVPLAAALALDTRAELVDVERSGSLRAAAARGLSRREAMLRHGYRNALLPLLPAAGRYAVQLIAATVVVETVFYLPGLGRLALDAVSARDVLVVRAVVMVLVTLMAGTVFLVRLASGWADRRLIGRGAK